MLGRLLVIVTLLAVNLAGCLEANVLSAAATTRDPLLEAGSVDDVVVVAVVDGGINPYHLDWASATLPQHLDEDPANDLPLDAPAHAWLPGVAEAGIEVQPLHLTLTTNTTVEVETLIEADEANVSAVKRSTRDQAHVYHVPGTKIVGLVDFAGNGAVATSGAHGARAASVAAGNLFGTCPECVVVFVNNGPREVGFEWAISQPWIDVVTNSYGYSLLMRDRLYSGSDVEASRAASERGQTIFFSAGNGQANSFLVPNPTLFSSQEGPDWMITVGAVTSGTRGSYSGAGKPADLASIGSGYPSQGGDTIDGEGTFGGTSSATPTVAGTYARALWWARQVLDGPSMTQDNGTIATGAPVACGALRPDCELADGVLTATELRTRLLHGAVHTLAGVSVAGATIRRVGEEEFLGEGHGSYFGRMDGNVKWRAEFDRVVLPMRGEAAPLVRPVGEREHMIVDSWCRQQIWLPWTGGYFVDGETDLPPEDPRWPVRTAMLRACPHLFPPVR